MAGPTEAQVRAIVATVPGAAQMLDGVASKDGHVQVALAIDPADAKRAEPVRRVVEQALRGLEGVLS